MKRTSINYLQQSIHRKLFGESPLLQSQDSTDSHGGHGTNRRRNQGSGTAGTAGRTRTTLLDRFGTSKSGNGGWSVTVGTVTGGKSFDGGVIDVLDVGGLVVGLYIGVSSPDQIGKDNVLFKNGRFEPSCFGKYGMSQRAVYSDWKALWKLTHSTVQVLLLVYRENFLVFDELVVRVLSQFISLQQFILGAQSKGLVNQDINVFDCLQEGTRLGEEAGGNGNVLSANGGDVVVDVGSGAERPAGLPLVVGVGCESDGERSGWGRFLSGRGKTFVVVRDLGVDGVGG